jgi:hypothetical protein
VAKDEENADPNCGTTNALFLGRDELVVSTLLGGDARKGQSI